MKKTVLAGCIAVFLGGTALAQTSQEGKLPQAAQDFIGKHFPSETVTGVEKGSSWEFWDNDDMYEAYLSNGVSIDFNKNGEVTEISTGKGTKVPAAALPVEIVSYVESNYSGLAIVSWGKDDKHQEIELENGREFEFDRNGKFLREDF